MSNKAETFQKADQQFSLIACGVDLVEYATFTRYIELGEDRFIQRIYTDGEQDYCAGNTSCLAARFAVKEAVSKALGTGIRGVNYREIEVVHTEHGKPLLHLFGQAAAVAEQSQLGEWSISLSHAEHFAVAFAVALRQSVTISADIAANVAAAQIASLEQLAPSSVLQRILDETSRVVPSKEE